MDEGGSIPEKLLMYNKQTSNFISWKYLTVCIVGGEPEDMAHFIIKFANIKANVVQQDRYLFDDQSASKTLWTLFCAFEDAVCWAYW